MKEFALTIPQGGSSLPTIIPTPEGIKSLNGVGLDRIISIATTTLMVFAAATALIFLVWGGIDIIMSEGDKQKIQNARQKVIFAIIGLVVVMASFFIVNVIGTVFGVKLFNTP